MKKRITITSFLMLIVVLTQAQTTIPGGDVSGCWTATGSPYLIEGDITVPDGSALVIEQGVTVEFQGYYYFRIDGLITAEGTEQDSIFFKAPGSSGHRGLKIYTDTGLADSIVFTYCRFQDGNCSGTWPDNCGGAIAVWEFDNIRIEHCLFIDNQAWNGSQAAGGALALAEFNGIIRYNSFIDNSSTYGGGIMAWNSTNCVISNNYFYDNYATYEGPAIQIWTLSNPDISDNIFVSNRANQRGGAISIYDESSPQISNNLFYNNLSLFRAGAVYVQAMCNPLILNNTIVDNTANLHGGAIEVDYECNPLIINNIIWGNSSPLGCQIYIADTICIPDFFHNDIMYGKDSIGGAAVIGEWKSNIDLDPLFLGPGSGDYHLDALSPCIDAGTDTIIDPDGTVSDLGAFYFDQATGVYEQHDNIYSLNIFCWPNPVVDEVMIGYQMPGSGCQDGRLVIYSPEGKQMDEILMKDILIRYNASHLQAGIYVVRVQAGKYVGSCRMVKK